MLVATSLAFMPGIWSDLRWRTQSLSPRCANFGSMPSLFLNNEQVKWASAFVDLGHLVMGVVMTVVATSFSADLDR
jgi:hypothetical protein